MVSEVWVLIENEVAHHFGGRIDATVGVPQSAVSSQRGPCPSMQAQLWPGFPSKWGNIVSCARSRWPKP